ncbi:MAG: hypothetical protein IJT07_05150 [Oscillospiraceae bacterium]|nr:hypothetical protein [Oscillospiraceae bacterium]
MKHITKISAFLLAVALLVGVSVSAVEVKNYSENVKVLLNGTDLFAGSTAKPVIINNRCMVPEQPLFSKLSSIQEFPEVGFAKEGVAPYKEFFAAQGGDFSVWLYLNDTKIHAGWSDGKTIDAGTIDVPATTYNGTTYLPLRAFIEKCYGGKVNWDAASRTVSVTVSKEDEGEVWAQAYSSVQSQGATSNVEISEDKAKEAIGEFSGVNTNNLICDGKYTVDGKTYYQFRYIDNMGDHTTTLTRFVVAVDGSDVFEGTCDQGKLVRY